MKSAVPKTTAMLLLLSLLLLTLAGCENKDVLNDLSRYLTWEALDQGEKPPEQRIKEIKESLAYYQEIPL